MTMLKAVVCAAAGLLCAVGGFGRTVTVQPGSSADRAIEAATRGRKTGEKTEVVFADGTHVVTKAFAVEAGDGGWMFRAEHPGRATIVGGRLFRGADAGKDLPKGVRARLPKDVVGKARTLVVPEEDRALFVKGMPGGESCGGNGEHFHRKGHAALTGVGATYPMLAIDGHRMRLAEWPNAPAYHKQDKEGFVGPDWIRPPSPRAAKWNLGESNRIFVFGFIMGTCTYAQTMRELVPQNDLELSEADETDGDDVGVSVKPKSEKTFRFKKGWGQIKPGSRYRFVNVMEELDAPGEWCYDQPSGTIVFIPPEGFSADSVIALGTASDHFFRIEGDGNRVEGLRFCAKIGLPALCVDGGRSNVVEGCTFSAMDAYAVYASGRGTAIRSCDFRELSGGGVKMQGGSLASGERGGNAVENCIFEDCCLMRYGWGYGGVTLGGFGNAVRHCLFRRFVEEAMSYSGFGHTVEYNRFYDTSVEFTDAAAVYVGGIATYGNVFRYNDVGSAPKYCNAWYGDNMSCGNAVYGNVFRGYGHYGAFLGGGRDNVVSNNVFLAGGGAVHIDNRGLFWPEWKERDKVHEGLCRAGYTNALAKALYPRFARMKEDGELMCAPVDNAWVNNLVLDMKWGLADLQICAKKTFPLERLHSEGNVYLRLRGGKKEVKFWKLGGFKLIDGTPDAPLDPGFVDLPSEEITQDKSHFVFRKGDFNLKPDSLVKKEIPGWQPIPWDKIGPYADRWRKTVR